MVNCEQTLKEKWATLHFGEVKIEADGEQHVFEVQTYLDDLDPAAVRVELYADGVNSDNPQQQEMCSVRQLAGSVAGMSIGGSAPAIHSATDYTTRVIPCFAGIAVPLKEAHIL